jgi:hypothetical protein
MTCNECNSPVFASVATSNEDGELFPTDITAEDIVVADTPNAQEQTYDEELHNIGFEQRSIDIEQPVSEAQEVPIEHIEAEKLLFALEPVSYNDVLDVHQYLDAFEGDFETLMS